MKTKGTHFQTHYNNSIQSKVANYVFPLIYQVVFFKKLYKDYLLWPAFSHNLLLRTEG